MMKTYIFITLIGLFALFFYLFLDEYNKDDPNGMHWSMKFRFITLIVLGAISFIILIIELIKMI